ncbi:hypothetical protein [uncultured Roseibium sp.]|uniref:hypothetical protein n=1 Tax=uncultured Roseibium sp. TaxID=1936171 RepID=UPI002623EA5D|nr:hypothetical protein [uncultured Roseibium sp.]
MDLPSTTINLEDVSINNMMSVFFPCADRTGQEKKKNLLVFLFNELTMQVAVNRIRKGFDVVGEELLGFDYTKVVEKISSLGGGKIDKPNMLVQDVYAKLRRYPAFIYEVIKKSKRIKECKKRVRFASK